MGSSVCLFEIPISNQAKGELPPLTSGIHLENYPNPFTNETFIHLSIPEDENINLKIIDMQGRVIKVFAKNKQINAGNHQFLLDGRDYPNGLYFCLLETTEKIVVTKLIKFAQY